MGKKIAITIQRYGLEVNGGAELYARILAKRLNALYDVEVLTTCALENTTWKDHYPEGLCEINGVKIRRFAVNRPRDTHRFNTVNTRLFTTEKGNHETEQEWVCEQGPYCPGLIDFIKDNKDKYDVFIFVTYLYYITACGIGLVREKAILIPTAHDEPPIYFSVYKNVFTCPRAIIFNTEEEQKFVHKLFKNREIPNDIIGLGIDVPEKANPNKFRAEYGSYDYLLYVGRIDEGKNCAELFDYFLEYKKRNSSNLKLVLIGKEIIRVPRHPDVISLGFVSEEDKAGVMSGAKMLVLHSLYESLSLVVLESMALRVPVVVNGKCAVLKGHCVKSNAGLYYKGYFEFESCINYLLTHDVVYAAMRQNAKKYVEHNYRWDVIMNKLKKIIESV